MSESQNLTIPDIKIVEVYKAPIAKVWEAVSTSEGIEAWFMPNDFKPELGHAFVLHSPFEVSQCKVTELDPPSRLAFTWGEYWTVTFELKKMTGADSELTEFTLIHSGWSEDVVEQHGMTHAAIRERMNGGWSSSVLPALRKLVEGEA
ncbi:polyketide cyclase [Paenibacillus swuensis]|uniref:Polyketide cyclase n=1 Tax=Paenibacillus swuensis TaxID=1178515 RepID=A0A172TFG5_9BACL|nr:SRPBCC domain-containing protein [Paenibacillus swuensis]ANE45750.1 polyketide cyclase [Paenibacillus swuensis]